MIIPNALYRRVLDISFRHRLSHIGSCLTALPILYGCYYVKRPMDKVILSAGHSGLSLYTVLEHFTFLKDAEATLVRDGIHPVRNPLEGIEVSSGSLGMAATVAVGIGLANPDKSIHIISTDGELAEGALWEALYYLERKRITNVFVHLNLNGYTALDSVQQSLIVRLTKEFEYVIPHWADPAMMPPIPGFIGLAQHYHVMNDTDYKIASEFFADK